MAIFLFFLLGLLVLAVVVVVGGALSWAICVAVAGSAAAVVARSRGARWTEAAGVATLVALVAGLFAAPLLVPLAKTYALFDGMRPPKVELTALTHRTGETCGLDRDGEIVCWTHLAAAVRPAPAGPFVALGTKSDAELCGLRADGTIVCAGAEGDEVALPGRYTRLEGSCAISAEGFAVSLHAPVTPPAVPASDVACRDGGARGCALVEDGAAIACWGSRVTDLVAPEGARFVDVALTAGGSCALDDRGDVHCDDGLPVVEDAGLASIEGSLSGLCGRTRAGGLRCFGRTPAGGELVTYDREYAHTGDFLVDQTSVLVATPTGPVHERYVDAP
jgi:hypothetical protein